MVKLIVTLMLYATILSVIMNADVNRHIKAMEKNATMIWTAVPVTQMLDALTRMVQRGAFVMMVIWAMDFLARQ